MEDVKRVRLLEASIERTSVKRMRDAQAECLKLNVQGRRGWTDYLVIPPNGRLFVIEFKRLGEEPRKLQLYLHKRLLDRNLPVYVCDNVAAAWGVYLRHAKLRKLALPSWF